MGILFPYRGLIDQVYVSKDQVNGRAGFHARYIHEFQAEYL